MPAKPTHEELAEPVASQAALIAWLTETIAAWQAQVGALSLEVAELRRQLGRDSTNSGQPSSKDSIAAKARRKAGLSSRERSKDRKPGGQPGRKGSGLQRAAEPDRTERIPDPESCGGCGGLPAGARRLTDGWAQVWDVLPAVLQRAHYELSRLRCSCGHVACGSAPGAQAGSVAYGPNLNAYAVLLQAEGNVPVERAAMLTEALLGVPVSTGFAAKALPRGSARLQQAGFEEAMAQALRAEDVLCGDESPVNLLHKNQDEKGAAVVLRTPDTRLTWYGAIDARSSAELAALPPLRGFTGILVRDDYAGWHSYDPLLAGVQQCCTHLIRHLKGCPASVFHHARGSRVATTLTCTDRQDIRFRPCTFRLEQSWAKKVIDVLRAANTAVRQALAEGRDTLDPDLLAGLRAEYDQRVAIGVSVNEERPWHDGNHPGYRIAARLRDKAEQV